MSQVRNIYNLIQKTRDEMKDHWNDRNEQQHILACERDKQCRDLQAKLKEAFPDEFPQVEGA